MIGARAEAGLTQETRDVETTRFRVWLPAAVPQTCRCRQPSDWGESGCWSLGWPPAGLTCGIRGSSWFCKDIGAKDDGCDPQSLVGGPAGCHT